MSINKQKLDESLELRNILITFKTVLQQDIFQQQSNQESLNSNEVPNLKTSLSNNLFYFQEILNNINNEGENINLSIICEQITELQCKLSNQTKQLKQKKFQFKPKSDLSEISIIDYIKFELDIGLNPSSYASSSTTLKKQGSFNQKNNLNINHPNPVSQFNSNQINFNNNKIQPDNQSYSSNSPQNNQFDQIQQNQSNNFNASNINNTNFNGSNEQNSYQQNNNYQRNGQNNQSNNNKYSNNNSNLNNNNNFSNNNNNNNNNNFNKQRFNNNQPENKQNNQQEGGFFKTAQNQLDENVVKKNGNNQNNDDEQFGGFNHQKYSRNKQNYNQQQQQGRNNGGGNRNNSNNNYNNNNYNNNNNNNGFDSKKGNGNIVFEDESGRNVVDLANKSVFGRNLNNNPQKNNNFNNNRNYNDNQSKENDSSGDNIDVEKQSGLGKNNVLKKKFNPPMSKEEREKKQVQQSKTADERYKHLDQKLVEMIMSEIVDSSPNVSFDDIAGLQFAKNTLEEIIIFPMLRPDLFSGLRSPPKGLLLFGPPGTGKTLIGKAIASSSHATFFSISASSLTSKWVGEGEKMVKTLFQIATIQQPSVIFIDEIDSLLCSRSENDNEASRRIKTEFLVQLDGAHTSAQDRILMIGATNRPQELDEAVRRRFVKRLYIPLPNSEARQALITTVLASEAIKGNNSNLSPEGLSEIVQLTKGYSGSDMKNLCAEASMVPIRDCIHQLKTLNQQDIRAIDLSDFKTALKLVKPSVSSKDLNGYLEWNDNFGSFNLDQTDLDK